MCRISAEGGNFFTGQVYNGTSMQGIYSGMSGFINQSYPSSTVNYEEAVNRAAAESGVPAFSFEVGQFQVFPDVLSELDSSRQNYLLQSIHNIQTLITCTGLDDFISNRFRINRVFQVSDGTVTLKQNQQEESK